jgi:hypothetical protein
MFSLISDPAAAAAAGCKLWDPMTGACLGSIDTGYALCCVYAPGNRHALVGTKVRCSNAENIGAVVNMSLLADVVSSSWQDVRCMRDSTCLLMLWCWQRVLYMTYALGLRMLCDSGFMRSAILLPLPPLPLLQQPVPCS